MRCPRGSAAALLLLLLLAGACAGQRGGPDDDSGQSETTPPPSERPEARFWETFRAAGLARREGDPARAVALYSEALSIDGEHRDSLYYLGQLSYLRGDVETAAALFDRLAELEPGGLRAWQQLSLVKGQRRDGWAADLEGATLAARQALGLNRGESLNHLLLARWAAYGGDGDGARRHLDEALGHNPNLQPAQSLLRWLDADGAADTALSGRVPQDLGPAYLVDLDGDGGPDLEARVTSDRKVALLSPEGSPALLPTPGRFSQWDRSGLARGPWPVPAAGVMLGADDGPTLVLVGGGPASARAYRGQPTLLSEIPSGLPELRGTPVAAAADFDGDGIDELLLGNAVLVDEPTAHAIGLQLYRSASGGLRRASDFAIPGPVRAAATGDIDGDGDPDLIVAVEGRASRGDQRATSAIEVDVAGPLQLQVWNNEAGSLRRGEEIVVDQESMVRALVAADLDGDGDADLLAVAGRPDPESIGQPYLWLGSPDGLQAAHDRLPRYTAGTVGAWRIADGVLLAIGGTVAGEPRRHARLALR